MRLKDKWSGHLQLVLAAICWGSAMASSKYALGGFAPMTLLVIELAVATVVLWVMLLLSGHQRPPRLLGLALLGLFEPALTYAAVTFGLTFTGASEASLLAGTESVWVVVLSALVLRQRPGKRAILGVLAATIGVASLNGTSPTVEAGWGELLILGSALCAAIYVIMASRVATEVEPLTMTAYQFAFGLLFSLPFAVLPWLTGGSDDSTISPGPRHWAAAIFCGVIGMAASFLLYNRAISRVPVAIAGMTLNLIPLFGLVAAVLALGESIDGWQIAGAALILVGIMLFPTEAEEEPQEPPEADLLAAGQTDGGV